MCQMHFRKPAPSHFHERTVDDSDYEMNQGRVKRVRSSEHEYGLHQLAKAQSTTQCCEPSTACFTQPNAPPAMQQEIKISMQPEPFAVASAAPPIPSFPAKLRQILSRPDFSSVITWTEDGQAWQILKPREFEIRVIPNFFNHSKHTMFLQEAISWGFSRLDDTAAPVFANPHFRRDAPELEVGMSQSRPTCRR